MRIPIILAVILALTTSALAADPESFMTEEAARRHCPKDTVVWLNVAMGVYYLKGERLYGRTQPGAYVCELEALKAGYAGSWTMQ